ncbi:slr1957 family protein [Aerosakkonema funiforme]|uniref:Uncharacterized protein n=1 Tax=Aerosakkonema funiforme FACHB-1375 TaxID=2949571 RepID=A0A926VKM7_9CYAN|nr:hypothetical protein [Aerosakkonema funiforme]MBD2185657.1 hypothetical protein [Aerosakkonema funiforme FACHB-1375]
MKHYADEWVAEWCQENGWTDLTVAGCDTYWAFPPGAVMPEPIPSKAMKLIKAQKGLSGEEKWWAIASVAGTIVAAIVSLVMKCPMPMVGAFAFCAVTVGQLEVED